jgi:LmbE family N-acetylglucosaminyl deacetylase
MKEFKILQALSVLLFLLFFSSLVNAANSKILVISAHPDDDILTSSGVIYKAAQRGDQVEVVYMTNGDYTSLSAGYTRQGEAVDAQAYLGLAESNLIFLGYPDYYLNDIYSSIISSQTFTTPNNNQSVTYGNRGLGSKDYHTYKFGSPAIYNKDNIVQDLASIITDFKPDHIFTLADFDQYPDHNTTYKFLQLALTAVRSSDPTYNPTIHKTCVWWTTTSWPNLIDPTSFFSELPNFLGISGLNWSDRESLDVPLVMQSTKYMTNKKFLAIAAHYSQGGDKIYGQFVHKDEIFWTENYVGSNKPPVPDAGLDQTVSEGAVVQLDGSGSHDPDGDILTFQWVQAGGGTVSLLNANTAKPTFTAPTGLKQDAVLTFQLVVNDGSLSSVPDSVNVIVHATTPDPYANLNIAPLATVTASSETAQSGQLATKAIDGVIDGSGTYPGDVTKEWATNGETSGAWLQLVWPSPYKVNRVTLYDRPNADDQILSATLLFSDGTTLQVGPLDNFGGATEYTFQSPVTTTSLKMTVITVSGFTYNVGLAEIEVYGVPAGMQNSQTTLSSSSNPSTYGSSVTFTATVTAGAFGTVTFKDNGLPLGGGIVTLPSGTSNTVTFSTSALTGGTHTVTAVYSGDAYHNTSTGTLTQTVNQPTTSTNLTSTPNPSTYGSSITFTATVTPSDATGTVAFFVDGSATPIGTSGLSGGSATLNTSSLGGGVHSITAVYSGDTNYMGSNYSNYAHSVNKADQTITFGALTAKTFGDADFNPGASTTSNLLISYASTNSAVAMIVNNQIHIVGVGSTTITASQAGDTNYNAAPTVTQNLTVSKANQTITFGALAAKTFGDANFNPGATATSNLLVSYASTNSAVATIVNNQIHIVGVGSTTITASQAGDTNYNAAPTVTQNLTVSKADQTITFGALAAKTFGDADFNPGAMATSNLLVSYASTNSAVATIVNNQIHIVGVGSATITASQGGDTNYNAATNVTQTLTVGPAPTSLSISAPAIKLGENGTVTVTVSSGVLIPTGNVSLSVDGGTAMLGSVTGTGIATFPIPSPSLGNHTLYATYAAQGNFGASSPASGTLSVGLAGTTTTITAPATLMYGASGSVTVTVSSGAGTPTGSVSLKVDNTTLPAQGLVNGSTTFTITSLSAGSHALSASYAAQGDFGASSSLVVNLTATTRPLTITADAKTKVYGVSDPALTFQITSGSLVGSDSFSGSLTRTTGEAIGSYVIHQGTITAGSNYQVTYIGANLTVTARPLTITADAKTKVYGVNDPVLTFQITSGSLVVSDSFSGALTRAAGEAVGSYAIQQGTLTVGSNYQITYSGANLTIIADGKLDGGSGSVDINDALKALRIAAGIDPLGTSDLAHGDVAPLVNGNPNPDGKIDLDDVVAIMRKAVNLPSW